MTCTEFTILYGTSLKEQFVNYVDAGYNLEEALELSLKYHEDSFGVREMSEVYTSTNREQLKRKLRAELVLQTVLEPNILATMN